MKRFTVLCMAVLFAALLVALPASAESITVIRGNGQLICLGCLNGSAGAFAPMVVRVTDDAGVGQANVLVNWNATGGFTSLISQTVTNAEGYTQAVVFPQSLPNSSAFQSFASYVITASTAAASATLYATVATPGAQSLGVDPIRVFATTVPVGGRVTGQVGETGAPIELRVFDDKGNPVPKVALFLVNNQSPSVGPVVNCQGIPGAGEYTVLTDNTGSVSCTPVFGGTPNVAGQFSVLVGGAYPGGDTNEAPRGYWNSQPSGLFLTAATPASITITGGAGQTTNPGRVLPSLLEVQVSSAAGTPLAGQQVRWTLSPASAGSVPNAITTTAGNGRATTQVTIGPAALGTVTVTATSVTDPSKSVTFAITVVPVITITGFQIFSGNNQSAQINSTFGQPLVVLVTTNGSAANIPVQFTSAGPVSLSTSSASTDGNGLAQVTVTAGSITGAATVTATVASATGIGSQTFNLTVLPPAPVITASNFVNGADGQANSFSACSIAALLAPAGTFTAQVGPTFLGHPLSTTNVKIGVNNVGAPVLNVANAPDGRQQVLFQIPCETQPGTGVPVTVNAGGATSNVSLNIQAASPGVFQTVYSDGVSRPILIRPDGSFVTLAAPAKKGEALIALVTGLGATSPAVGTGSVAAPGAAATPTGQIIVGMNGGGVPLFSAKRSEDLPGVFLVTFQIPQDMPSGNQTFSIGLNPTGGGNIVYSGTSRIPVQ